MGGKKPQLPPVPKPQPLPEYKPPPAPEPIAKMPTPDDAALATAAKKKQAMMMQRSGRASTNITGNEDDKLG